MKQSHSQIFVILLSIGLLTAGCDKIFSNKNDYIYSISFEKNENMDQWENGENAEYKSDTPTHDGKRSLYVSGGCVVPHMILNRSTVTADTHYNISFWGKTLINSGIVQLYAENNSNEKIPLGFVQITHKNWTLDFDRIGREINNAREVFI
ncbi:MAG TPA: hypothetical protein QF484_04120 [Candidatus Marinimicrobia bacterium]|jgi:hypothetical protein|nr:hypothetical protein [Candidatus Neomarinimicrobiota bacterium]MDP7565862.1 hypothetical protein [Candidatus Neomarinimicrobiota bacterium]HJM12354.1 hypothetical protein [Candidatus Neomarinimicrobiota bacterium]|tara:strand:- start:13746 stop:14198 length:453 start_codon:yes stop_codon:yes gene_type:complete